MPHFVGIPATPNSPGLSSLSLKDPSGNAAVAVWAANMDWTIELCAPGNAYVKIDSNRFQSSPYKKDQNLFVSFMLRGLKGGDHIAAYDASGAPQTAALPIKSVSTDRPSNNLAARPSAFTSKLILNPAGAEQSDIHITGQEWVNTCERVIKYMLENALGRLIVSALPGNIDIFPFLSGEENADSSVKFAPQNFARNMLPGARPNEILFHELCHRAENAPAYVNNTDPTDNVTYVYGGNGVSNDFFTVIATNVYASMRQRPLRKDHAGFMAMPPKFANTSGGAAGFRAIALSNFNLFQSRNAALNTSIRNIVAPWNPF